MRRFITSLALIALAASSKAADQPQYAPPADWVKPQEIPVSGAPDSTTPTRLLLEDLQDKFDANGQSSYLESVAKIQTSDGLAAAGNVTFSWKPDTESLTIHKLRILRGDRTIDLLSGGHTFTVLRRENNLEMAMLDGALTAAIQPEGLQVGDILDIAVTLHRNDPVLQGRAERLTGNLVGAHIDRLMVREIWPKSVQMRWREGKGLPPVKIINVGDTQELTIDANVSESPVGPKGAPPRYFELGQLEGTQFKSWAEVSALVAPLFQKASMLTAQSPLKLEAAKIKAASSDQQQQAMAALKLVENQIRYFFLGMNNGGYVPADADVTWSRRFGDCKGKTAVLIALLRELGIEAEPALASMAHGDGLDERSPMLGLFDHVLVRAVIGGKVYWLDGTRVGDRTLADLPTPAFHWLLPVQERGAALVKLSIPQPDKPLISTELQLDATAGAGAPAPAHGTMTFRGDAGIVARLQLSRQSREDAERFVRDFWKKGNDELDIRRVDFAYNEQTGEEVLTVDGAANMRWIASGNELRYEINGSIAGFKPDFYRDPASDQNAPFTHAYPYYMEATTTILLPQKGAGFRAEGADVSTTLAGTVLNRKTVMHDGTLLTTVSAKNTAPEFSAPDAKAAEEPLRKLATDAVYLYAPGSSGGSPQSPPPENEYIDRGHQLLDNHKPDDAIAEFDHAIEINPNSARALADRGVAYATKGNPAKATADLDKAFSINPRDVIIFHGRGLLAESNGDTKGAMAAFSHAVEIQPNDVYALEHRGLAHLNAGELDLAVYDWRDVLRLNPKRKDIRERLIGAYLAAKQDDEALKEADALVALDPADAAAHRTRGNTLAYLQRKDEAAAEYDRALQLKPSIETYLARAALNRGNPDKSLADINAAIALDGKSAAPLIARALFFSKSGDFRKADADMEQAIKLDPDNLNVMRVQADMFAQEHDYGHAIQATDTLLAKKPNDPILLNNRCWYRAISGTDLDKALADCNASIKVSVSPNTLDSRAFVYFRLGRLDDAINDYDAALKLRPKLSSSLFGRGLAKLRKGADADGQVDLAAARAVDAKVDATFADYGVKP